MPFRGPILLTLAILVVATGSWSFAQRDNGTRSAAPEDTFPAQDCIAFWSFDGLASHESEWQETAFFESIVDSGLAESVIEYVRSILAAQGVEDPEVEEAVTAIVNHVRDYGGGVAAYPNSFDSSDPPEVAVAIGNGAEFQKKLVAAFLALNDVRGQLGNQLSVEQVDGRTILTLDGDEFTSWVDNGLLYIAGPPQYADAIEERIANSDGMVRSHRLFPTGENICRSFVDTRSLFAVVDEAVGPSKQGGARVNDMVEILGLSGLEGFTNTTGLNEAAIDSVSRIVVDPSNRGLFEAVPNESMTLADMPPLPANVTAFSFTRLNLTALYDELIKRFIRAEKKFGEAGEIEKGLAQAEQELGFPVRDFVRGFGDIFGLYDQTDAGLLAPPIVAVASVRDRALVRSVFRKLVEKGDFDAQNGISVQFAAEDSYDRITISTGSPASLSLGVSDKWAVAAMTPSYFGEFFDRVDDEATGWQPDVDLLKRRPELTGEFSSVTYVDVAMTWKTGMNFMPMAFGMVGQATGKPVPLPRLPRTRNITRPMFPNVGVSVETENGFEMRSSSSTPPLPVTVSGGAVTSPAMIGVGVALVLPAVQQAREAARRAQSRNNLRQIGLSLHNYHDVYQTLPKGTVETSAEEVDDRLSWFTSVTPFLEMSQVHDALDKDLPWNDPTNLDAVEGVNATAFQNPNIVAVPTIEGVSVATYVGCGGVGQEAVESPTVTKKTGLFGVNRGTKIRDILDGLSNTLMVGEVNQDLGAWSAGGNATVRGFTEEPYINGPDGFGGNFAGGCNFLLGDGSVRFVSENIDSSVAEALMTAAGGEAIGDF